MKTEQISEAVQQVQALGDEVLGALKVAEPGVGVPVQVAETVLDLLAKMISAAIDAFGHAAGTPITTASIEALLPNQTPLTAPSTPGV